MTDVRLSILGESVIQIGDSRITPSASHAFALLLLLSLRSNPLSRAEAVELLFGGDGDAPGSKQRLRQMLYRLRGLGACIAEDSSGLAFSECDALDPLAPFERLTPKERASLAATRLAVLPNYAPHLGRQYASWVEDYRDDIQRKILSRLAVDIRSLIHDRDWSRANTIGATLLSLDPCDGTIVGMRAESLIMLGQRDEALVLIDAFLRDQNPHGNGVTALRTLRTRALRASVSKRSSCFVGREDGLAFLHAQWSRSQEEEGTRLTLISGAPGIGKTRIAEEFSRAITLRGAHVLRYKCDAHSCSQPLALFSHLLPELRAMRGSLGADPLYRSALDKLELATLPSAHPSYGLPTEALRSDTQKAIVDLLDAISGEQPLMLVIDDAHNLDEASEAIIYALTSTTLGARLHLIACIRRSSTRLRHIAPSPRVSVIELLPLTFDESQAVLFELRPAFATDTALTNWCLTEAAGNPFYLHLLATHSQSASPTLPLDIRSLASTAYGGLAQTSRDVLDSALLLGRFATLDRVISVTRCSDNDMLPALRNLEEGDLLYLVDAELRGPHALLSDALRSLIPTSVAGLLHRRIASLLESECVSESYPTSLAWASAQHWLAAGDSLAAVRLLSRCASQAANIGEPGAAAALLDQVPLAELSLNVQQTVLDEIVAYAYSGGSRQLAATALRKRFDIAHTLREPPGTIRGLELRIIEADLLNGAPIEAAVEPLLGLLSDRTAEPTVRAQAAVKLMVVADIQYDGELAEAVHDQLAAIYSDRALADPHVLRAELVFQTTFGNLAQARAIAVGITQKYPSPSSSDAIINSRHFAAYSLYRMRSSTEAARIAEDNYSFMLSVKLFGEALYSASLRSEIAITEGDFDCASEWLTRADTAARGVPPHQLSPNSGYHANAGILAMLDGRYEEAERLLLAPQRDYALLASARYRAASIALILRLKRRRGDDTTSLRADIEELRELYVKGRHFGGQDSVVEALWCADRAEGHDSEATAMLRDYLTTHRRENCRAEWFFRTATASDPAWLDFPSL
ncbi:MAG: AAA family ATPase [Gemmatimonadaceae bacterium]